MVVRELVALLGVKTDKKSMGQAQSGMKKLISFAKVAAAAFAAFKLGQWMVRVAESVAKVGDQFDKMAKRTGVAFDALQGFSHAAQLSGASIEDVETSIKRLQASQADAAFGLKTYTREFERLGIDIKDTNGEFKDTTTLLLEVADGMKNLDTDTERTAVAVKLLGRSGTNLIPLLREGSDAIKEMMQEARDLGAVMDEDLRQASVDYIDNQQRLNMMWIGMKNIVGKELLPIFIRMQEATIEWWKANRKWIMERIAPKLKTVAQVAGNLADAITDIVSAIGEWTGKLTPLQNAIIVIGGLLMAGPIGTFLLLSGLIALIIDDFMTWRKGGKSVIGEIDKALKDFLDIGLEDIFGGWVAAFGAVFDLWKKIMTSWFQTFFAFVEFLVNVWDDPAAAWSKFVDDLAWIWEDAINWIKGIATEVGDYLRGVWQSVLDWLWDRFKWVEFYQDLWAEAVAVLESVFGTVVPLIQKVWDFIVEFATTIADILLTPFKSLLEFFKDIFEVGIVEAFERLGTKIKEWAGRVVGYITAPFKKVGEFVSDLFGGEEGRKAPPVGAGARVALGMGHRGALGEIPGAARVAAGRAGGNVSQKTNVEINVKGTPGMSEAKIGSEVARQVEKVIEKQNRAAMKALTPAAAAGV